MASAGCGGPSTGSPAASTASGALPPPTFSKSVDLRLLSGSVRVKLPGAGGFVALQAARQVPLGTVIDVRAGVVRLSAAYPLASQFAVADFRSGVFEVLQDPAGKGLTDLRVQNTEAERVACGSGHAPSRELTGRQLGLLLGDGRGAFRTDGEFSAATVRGTAWGVRNRCDGTLTVVRRGIVLVTDFRLHKNVILHAGQTYLAKAR
jgi:hypothetical protein